MFRNNINIDKIRQDFGQDDVWKFQHLKGWMNKVANDGYEKYTYYWIAFNIYYNLIYFKDFPNRSVYDSKEIDRVLHVKSIISTVQMNDLSQKILGTPSIYADTLNSFSIEGKFSKATNKKEQLPEEINLAVGNGDYLKAFDKLLRALYVIRCNLFHGIKPADDYSQNKLLDESAEVLKKIMSIPLEPYFFDK